MAIFPLARDQTIAQMWSNGVRGGGAIPLENIKTFQYRQIMDTVKNINEMSNYNILSYTNTIIIIKYQLDMLACAHKYIHDV